MTEVEQQQDVQEQERPRLSLQRRLGVVLSRNDTNISADELRQLIDETTAAEEADTTAQMQKAASLSLDCDDPVAADERQKAAMLERQRLYACMPRLEERLAAAVRRENRDRWMADRNRVAARRDAAAKHFREVRDIFADLVEIFKLAAEVDREVDRINAANPGNIAPLASVELRARKLDAFPDRSPVSLPQHNCQIGRIASGWFGHRSRCL